MLTPSVATVLIPELMEATGKSETVEMVLGTTLTLVTAVSETALTASGTDWMTCCPVVNKSLWSLSDGVSFDLNGSSGGYWHPAPHLTHGVESSRPKVDNLGRGPHQGSGNTINKSDSVGGGIPDVVHGEVGHGVDGLGHGVDGV